jgi:hypothetical protein
MSPRRPRIGSATAAASIGAVVTHEAVDAVVWRSPAITFTETVSKVDGNVVENIPTRQFTSKMVG